MREIIRQKIVDSLTAPVPTFTRRDVRLLLFLCAFLPRPGMSMNQQRAAEPIDAPYSPSSAEWTDMGQDVWFVYFRPGCVITVTKKTASGSPECTQ